MNFLSKFYTLCIVSILAAMSAKGGNTYFIAAGTVVVLADSSKGAKESLMPDEYTRAHTPFDLSIRLHKKGGLTEKDYLHAAAADVRSWPAGEAKQLEDAFTAIDAYCKSNSIRLQLPDTIILIKTTAHSELDAEGWTRLNRIMLNTAVQPISTHLVAHELFHVWSRYETKKRDAVYAIFGFQPCNNIEYKEAMGNRVITNPDCPFLRHYLQLKVNNTEQDVALMFYSNSDYEDGFKLDEHLQIGLLALTGDNLHKKPLLKDGHAVIYQLNEVPDLFTHIGINTEYILHIEEIAAEHFAALVCKEVLKQPELAVSLKEILQ